MNEGSGGMSLEVELVSFPTELILKTVLAARRAKGMDTKSDGGGHWDNSKPYCGDPADSWRVKLGEEERTCSVGSDLIGAEPLVP